MRSTTLYEIVDDARELYEMATDPDCDPELLQGSIDSVMGMLEVKAFGYTQVIKQLEMEQRQAEEVSKLFASKAETRRNNIKRMKDALQYAMTTMDLKEVPAGAFTIKLQNNGGQEPLIIDKPEEVPENMTKVTIEADKTKIREYLETQDGKSCEWAHIAPRGQHIVIK